MQMVLCGIGSDCQGALDRIQRWFRPPPQHFGCRQQPVTDSVALVRASVAAISSAASSNRSLRSNKFGRVMGVGALARHQRIGAQCQVDGVSRGPQSRMLQPTDGAIHRDRRARSRRRARSSRRRRDAARHQSVMIRHGLQIPLSWEGVHWRARRAGSRDRDRRQSQTSRSHDDDRQPSRAGIRAAVHRLLRPPWWCPQLLNSHAQQSTTASQSWLETERSARAVDSVGVLPAVVKRLAQPAIKYSALIGGKRSASSSVRQELRSPVAMPRSRHPASADRSMLSLTLAALSITGHCRAQPSLLACRCLAAFDRRHRPAGCRRRLSADPKFTLGEYLANSSKTCRRFVSYCVQSMSQ